MAEQTANRYPIHLLRLCTRRYCRARKVTSQVCFFKIHGERLGAGTAKRVCHCRDLVLPGQSELKAITII